MSRAYYLSLSPEERWQKITEILSRNVERIKQSGIDVDSNHKGLTKNNLYSSIETAKILNVSYRTVQRWVASGKLIPIKMEKGRWLFGADQIDILGNTIRFKKYPLLHEKKKAPQKAPVKEFVLSNTGIIRKKVHGKNKCEVFSLLCPNDKKHLGEIPLDYFDKARTKNKPHGPVFIHCTKCDRTIRFQKKYSHNYKFEKEE